MNLISGNYLTEIEHRINGKTIRIPLKVSFSGEGDLSDYENGVQVTIDRIELTYVTDEVMKLDPEFIKDKGRQRELHTRMYKTARTLISNKLYLACCYPIDMN